MSNSIIELREKIEQLQLSEEQKLAIFKELKQVEKTIERANFRYARTLKDKSIAVNLLNRSITDLETNQVYIEQTNQQLQQQKEEIEAQNLVLNEQKRLLEEQSEKLEHNLRELKNSYQELEQFSYIASHDLKSPLRTIASYSQLLHRRYGNELDDQAKEFINFIVTGANHMNDIICDLLEYSKAGRNKQRLDKTDLNRTLELVKFNLQHEIQENQAVVNYEQLPELLVSKSGMLQLFQNLISNSIKFRQNCAPVIQISSCPSEKGWLFKVSDNGVGMDENYQNKAFQPFQRLNNRDRPGTGMGLAICKKIVTMHQGKIWYCSGTGEGTTFYFTLPERN